MKLKELLLEFDTKEQKYPGIKPKELVRDYKIRMQKVADAKAAKAEYDKSRYITVDAMKRGAVTLGNLEAAMRAVSTRNNYIRTEDQVDKGITLASELLPMDDEMMTKLKTKKNTAANKRRIVVSKSELNGITYWDIFDAKYYKDLEQMFMDAVNDKLVESEEITLADLLLEIGE